MISDIKKEGKDIISKMKLHLLNNHMDYINEIIMPKLTDDNSLFLFMKLGEGNIVQLFKNEGSDHAHNILVFRIQPNEGVLLKFGLKVPGAGNKVKDVNMDFQYDDLTQDYVPDAYERLILDCMQGDSTLYARGDSVENSWKFINPILKIWQDNPKIPIYGYPAGTWGPKHINELIDGKNMAWRNASSNLSHDGEYCEL